MSNASSKEIQAAQRPKMIYNRATGEFEKNTSRNMDTTAWWFRKAGLGGMGAGKGKAAVNRRQVLDSNIEAVDKMTVEEGEKRWPILLPNRKKK